MLYHQIYLNRIKDHLDLIRCLDSPNCNNLMNPEYILAMLLIYHGKSLALKILKMHLPIIGLINLGLAQGHSDSTLTLTALGKFCLELVIPDAKAQKTLQPFLILICEEIPSVLGFIISLIVYVQCLKLDAYTCVVNWATYSDTASKPFFTTLIPFNIDALICVVGVSLAIFGSILVIDFCRHMTKIFFNPKFVHFHHASLSISIPTEYDLTDFLITYSHIKPKNMPQLVNNLCDS